jgi:hypothetical protein
MQKVPGPTLGWKIAVVWEAIACGLVHVSEEPTGSIFGVETSVYIYGKEGHSVTSKYTIFTSRPKVISHLDVTNRTEGGQGISWPPSQKLSTDQKWLCTEHGYLTLQIFCHVRELKASDTA